MDPDQRERVRRRPQRARGPQNTAATSTMTAAAAAAVVAKKGGGARGRMRSTIGRTACRGGGEGELRRPWATGAMTTGHCAQTIDHIYITRLRYFVLINSVYVPIFL